MIPFKSFQGCPITTINHHHSRKGEYAYGKKGDERENGDGYIERTRSGKYACTITSKYIMHMYQISQSMHQL